MTFKLGPLPESPDFIPNDNWKLVQEPSPWGFQLRAIPIAVVTVILLAILWLLVTPLWQTVETMTFPLPISISLACIIGVIIVHEFIHVLIQPKHGVSDKTVVGFWPSRMFVYTLYVGELSKNRCLGILLTPFVVISIVPLVFAAVLQAASFWVAYISIVNGLLASGDIFAAIMTKRLVPNDAVIRTKAWLTYWHHRK